MQLRCFVSTMWRAEFIVKTQKKKNIYWGQEKEGTVGHLVISVAPTGWSLWTGKIKGGKWRDSWHRGQQPRGERQGRFFMFWLRQAYKVKMKRPGKKKVRRAVFSCVAWKACYKVFLFIRITKILDLEKEEMTVEFAHWSSTNLSLPASESF